MRVTDSAFTHGIAEADFLHAYINAVPLVEVEQHGEDRLIVIGPDRAGNWLELVAIPAASSNPRPWTGLSYPTPNKPRCSFATAQRER